MSSTKKKVPDWEKAAQALMGYGESKDDMLAQMEKLMRNMYEASGQRPDTIVMHPSNYHRLQQIISQETVRQGWGTSVHNPQGVSKVEFMGIPVVADPMAKPTEVYAVPKTPTLNLLPCPKLKKGSR